MKQTENTTNEPLQLDLEFTFQAPIELVFDTLTLPEHMKHWHSPNHLEITDVKCNPEVGGEYQIGVTVKGGDGTEMMFIGEYLEINRPNLLVYSQAFSPGNDAPVTAETKITIRLQQQGNQTLMKFKQTGFGNKRSLQGARTSWPEVYDKLSEYLKSLEETN